MESPLRFTIAFLNQSVDRRKAELHFITTELKERIQSHKRRISAKPESAINCTRHYPRSLFPILVLGAFLSECMAYAGDDQAAAEFTFNQYDVVIGSAKRQTVLTGFLLGGAMAELAVVNINGNDDRRLRIYAFDDGAWETYLDTTLRPKVLFVDVANIGGRDRLITYEPGRLNWFDPETATERALVEVTSNFNPPRSGEIPHVDITRDPETATTATILWYRMSRASGCSSRWAMARSPIR